MLVKGKTRGDLNVRTSPAVINGNIGFISRGIVDFEGELITSPLDNKQWIKLSKINGSAVFGLYIASWVVDYSEIPQVPQEPIGVPIELEVIEKFEDGITRTSIWRNPTVVE